MQQTNEMIYTVSELNQTTKMLLEENFENILLEGEISNFSCPASGHWYFTLKDDTAQIRCAMFRMNQHHLKFFPKDGMHVVVRAKVSLYTQRGEYQLIAMHMIDAGEGLLQQRFEALKEKLFKEGLFDAAHKIPLPTYPNTIAIITSATGAAIHDVLTVLKRRYPIAKIAVYPTLVQGAQAADTIVHMIQRADQEKIADVILLTRGGGSLEDLWCFNEEKVARAMYACELPIITGIGHEIDFTIADFVADVRAPTPSAAAETLTPDITEIIAWLHQQTKHLHQIAQSLLHQYALMLSKLNQRLQQQHPQARVTLQQQQLKQSQHKLNVFIQHLLSDQKNHLIALGKQLHQLSPLNTLDRGYAILFHDEQAITSIQKIEIGDTLNARLKDGIIHCTVTDKRES